MRRLEGRELHPQRDASGTHRFAPNEVETLVERLMASGSLLAASRASSESADEHWNEDSQREAQLLVNIDQLRIQLNEAHQRARKAVRQLDHFKARTAHVLSTLGRELIQFEPDLGDLVLAAMDELDE